MIISWRILISTIACLGLRTFASASVSACNIPSTFHGSFYSEDVPPFDKIVISTTEIHLDDTKPKDDGTAISGGESLQYLCQQILVSNNSVHHFIRIQVQNVNSMEYKCLSLEIMDENSNLLKWKETTEFEDVGETSDYCGSANRFSGHNPSLADGDFLFKWNPVVTPCPSPLFNTSQSFHYEFEVINRGRQTCKNDVNVLKTDASGDLQILWQKCPNVSDLYYPPMNKTLTCFGAWKDSTNAETILVADLNAKFDIYKYRCMWRAENEDDGFLRLRLGQATEDCSMNRGYRRSYVTFALQETISSGSELHIAGILLISAYFGAKSLTV